MIREEDTQERVFAVNRFELRESLFLPLPFSYFFVTVKRKVQIKGKDNGTRYYSLSKKRKRSTLQNLKSNTEIIVARPTYQKECMYVRMKNDNSQLLKEVKDNYYA